MNPDQYLHKVYVSGDRAMLAVLWVLCMMSVAMAGWYDTWGLALPVSLPGTLVVTVVVLLAQGSLTARLLNATAFMCMAAMIIHQGHGMIELHFGIFCELAFLLYYRDWRPVVMASAVTAVHHELFDVLQRGGAPVYVFEHHHGLGMVLMHGGYVVFEAIPLLYLAGQLRAEAIESGEIAALGKQLAVVDGVIDVRVRATEEGSAFARDFHHFMSAIGRTIGSARSSAAQLSSAMQDLNAAADHAGKAMELQESETQQMAGGVERMVATSDNMARQSRAALQAASSAKADAEKGRAAVQESLAIMQRLEGAAREGAVAVQRLEADSKRITAMVDVINDVVDQTSLLALNAAIEAARAGEAGRGFGVVADEVAKLAQNTRSSTGTIGATVDALRTGSTEAIRAMERSQEEAHRVLEHSREVDKLLQVIASSTATISELNDGIVAAADQQSTATQEVKQSIQSIRANASLAADQVQSTAGAAQEMLALSRLMEESVGQFRCDGPEAQRRPSRELVRVGQFARGAGAAHKA